MERARDLLKGSFWKLDLSRVKLSSLEIDFLQAFFDMSVDRVVDDMTFEEKAYLVLTKKSKFIQKLNY